MWDKLNCTGELGFIWKTFKDAGKADLIFYPFYSGRTRPLKQKKEDQGRLSHGPSKKRSGVWTKGERKTNKVEGLLLVTDTDKGSNMGKKSTVVTWSIVEERKIEGKEME